MMKSGDDDYQYLMNETRRKSTTGRQSPSRFDKWHGIFYMLSRIDTAVHTKALVKGTIWGHLVPIQLRSTTSNIADYGNSILVPIYHC